MKPKVIRSQLSLAGVCDDDIELMNGDRGPRIPVF
jgi:hypothetical protein